MTLIKPRWVASVAIHCIPPNCFQPARLAWRHLLCRTLKVYSTRRATFPEHFVGHDHRLGHNRRRRSLDGAELAKRNPGSSWPKR
jgi:hypothetical protein